MAGPGEGDPVEAPVDAATAKVVVFVLDMAVVEAVDDPVKKGNGGCEPDHDAHMADMGSTVTVVAETDTDGVVVAVTVAENAGDDSCLPTTAPMAATSIAAIMFRKFRYLCQCCELTGFL